MAHVYEYPSMKKAYVALATKHENEVAWILHWPQTTIPLVQTIFGWVAPEPNVDW